MATARTAQTLIDAALGLNGLYPPGGTPNTHFRAEALIALQDLIAELELPYATWEPITLVATQSSYTVGENGSPDLSTVRPEEITGAFVRDASNYDHYVRVLRENQWLIISSKTGISGRPNEIWYNPTIPNGIVYVRPVPASGESLYIASDKPMTEPVALTTDILNTTGIARNTYNPLKWILAEEVAPRYGKEATRTMALRAQDGRETITRINAIRKVEPAQLDVGAFSGRRYNILIGDFWG